MNKLIDLIIKAPNSNEVRNIYLQDLQRMNLSKYLKYYIKNPPHFLLVGEAPGHKGCGKTGIPFTDEFEIKQNSFLNKTIGLIAQEEQKENTSRKIWETFGHQIKEKGIMFWNIFPYHPIENGNENSNRTPRKSELKSTNEIWQEFRETIQILDSNIFCVGLTAYNALFGEPTSNYLRHPSYDGNAEFEKMFKEMILK
jgi:uracil-DNA glycosylase